MQQYVEVAVFAKKLTKDRVSVTISKQQLDIVICDVQVLAYVHSSNSLRVSCCSIARTNCK
jgi:hypothetical protein